MMDLQTIRFSPRNIPFLEDAPPQAYRQYRIHFGMISLPLNGGDSYLDLTTLSSQRRPFGQSPQGEAVDRFTDAWLLKTREGLGIRVVVAHHAGVASLPRRRVPLEEHLRGIYIGKTEEVLVPGEPGSTMEFHLRSSGSRSAREETRYVTPVY